jgi:hypothetical protein
MRTRTWFLAGLVALAVGSVGGVARADETMRCPSGRLVRVGDRLLELAQTCGAPDHTDRRTALREIARGLRAGTRTDEERLVVEVRIEEWLYDLGPGRLLRRLVFENGRLARIDTLGRGRR